MAIPKDSQVKFLNTLYCPTEAELTQNHHKQSVMRSYYKESEKKYPPEMRKFKRSQLNQFLRSQIKIVVDQDKSNT